MILNPKNNNKELIKLLNQTKTFKSSKIKENIKDGEQEVLLDTLLLENEEETFKFDTYYYVLKVDKVDWHRFSHDYIEFEIRTKE